MNKASWMRSMSSGMLKETHSTTFMNGVAWTCTHPEIYALQLNIFVFLISSIRMS